jgi:hypothetical protein
MEDRKVARKKRVEARNNSLSGLSGHSLYDIPLQLAQSKIDVMNEYCMLKVCVAFAGNCSPPPPRPVSHTERERLRERKVGNNSEAKSKVPDSGIKSTLA